MAGLPSRKVALQHLQNVLIHRRRLREHAPGAREISEADEARAKRLAESVLRNLNRADAVLRELIPRQADLTTLNILRLAVTEIFAGHAAPYAVVDQAVEIAKSRGSSRKLCGFINAVLRRGVEGGGEAWKAVGPKKLPTWIARKVEAAFGSKALREIESVHERAPPLDITLRHQPDSLRLATAFAATVLPTGSLRMKVRPQVSALPEFESGTWWVQDASAAVPVRLLGNLEGKEVLDLFAAPGGKSMQCAAAGAQVTAIDRSSSRLQLLEHNFERIGIDCVAACADALEFRSRRLFDVVIVDAPCTATGTIRRNPDLPHTLATPAKSLAALVSLQRASLEKAASLVRPKGKVLYCVCSLFPDEGENMVAQFAGQAGLRASGAEAFAEGIEPDWKTKEGGFRLRPDFWPKLGGMDGFYVAVLEKE